MLKGWHYKIKESYFHILVSRLPVRSVFSEAAQKKEKLSHYCLFKRRLQGLHVIYVMFVIGGRSRRSEARLSLNLHSEHCTNTPPDMPDMFFCFCFLQSTRWRRTQGKKLLEGEKQKNSKTQNSLSHSCAFPFLFIFV